MDNRNRLETVVLGFPLIKGHSLSNIKVNYRHHVECHYAHSRSDIGVEKILLFPQEDRSHDYAEDAQKK